MLCSSAFVCQLSFTRYDPGGVQGAKLDIYAKQWRLFADCLNNVGESGADSVFALPFLKTCLAMACAKGGSW